MGLQERFRVNNRDELADALQERLERLRRDGQAWHPEMLSLLLQLSDQPTYKTDIEDVYRVSEKSEERAVPLRWEDIAREERWDLEPELWETGFSSGDSDLDDIMTDMKDVNMQSDASTEDSTITEEEVGKTAKDYIIPESDTHVLASILAAQAWRHTKPTQGADGKIERVPVSELHVLREVLFMLHGLPTTIFGEDGPSMNYQIPGVTHETYSSLVTSFAESGKYLGVLRTFVEQKQQVPHIQTLQDCAAKQLALLDRKISDIEQRFAAPKGLEVVSVVAAKEELSPALEPLYFLTRVVLHAQHDRNARPYRYLELLFDEANAAQLSGSLETYDCIARIFVECFNVYLRPIRHWMDDGHIIQSKETFFILENTDHVAAGNVWQDRFRLEAPDGVLEAPKFLRLAASKIFNAGKNIVLLRLLGRFEGHVEQDELPLAFEKICPPELEFAPFSELFDVAFEEWIQSKYGATSSILKQVLLNDCELHSALQILSNLYFMSDGSAADSVFTPLFDKLNTEAPRWYDRYNLTGLAQDAYPITTNRLSISVSSEARRLDPIEAKSSVRTAIPHIFIHYRLPWALEMVLTEDSMAQYQSIFTFLLQIKMATHALHQKHLKGFNEHAAYYTCRRNLLWFCSNLQTYLSTIVLVPTTTKIQQDMMNAADVDGMITAHGKCIKLATAQSCLGTRLAPIRECILDTLDMALGLDVSDEYALEKMKDDFLRNIRFITEGLRSVARVNNQSLDILADMLQM